MPRHVEGLKVRPIYRLLAGAADARVLHSHGSGLEWTFGRPSGPPTLAHTDTQLNPTPSDSTAGLNLPNEPIPLFSSLVYLSVPLDRIHHFVK
jgi:hypothetical protein